MAVDFIEAGPTPTRGHKVWLIGGTSESGELARALWAKKIPYIVTVTTPSAKTLYPPQSLVRVGALTPGAMATFVTAHDIGCILDASHPFATEVSRQAIALSQASQSQASQSQSRQSQHNVATNQSIPYWSIPYLRYERASISQADAISTGSVSTGSVSTGPVSTGDIRKITDDVITVASIESLVKSDLLQHQRVLFTLGYRYLAQFSSLRPKATLFARVLPSSEAIAGALSAGFSAHEIIALRPPVSLALEKALWQQWQISRVVAKASGGPGGLSTTDRFCKRGDRILCPNAQDVLT